MKRDCHLYFYKANKQLLFPLFKLIATLICGLAVICAGPSTLTELNIHSTDKTAQPVVEKKLSPPKFDVLTSFLV